MTVNVLNLLPENSVEILRGASKPLGLLVTHPDKTPVNITGARIVFSVKEKPEDRNPIFIKTSDVPAQITITNARAGTAIIYLSPADTQNMDPKQYTFDVWVVLQSGERIPVIPPSAFVVQWGVTRISL